MTKITVKYSMYTDYIRAWKETCDLGRFVVSGSNVSKISYHVSKVSYDVSKVSYPDGSVAGKVFDLMSSTAWINISKDQDKDVSDILQGIPRWIQQTALSGYCKIRGAMCSFETDTHLHILQMPKTKTDGKNFHSLTTPSLEWDDVKIHMIHGVYFMENDWKQISSRQMPVLSILKIENVEQRRVALEIYGADGLFKELKPKLIDESWRGNRLYQTKIDIPRWVGGPSTPMILKFLQYRCPSTSRQYLSFVDPSIEKADKAMAFKFNMTEDEYADLRIEA